MFIILLILAEAICGLGEAASGCDDDLKNGLYLVSTDDSGSQVKSCDGSRVTLGERVDGRISNILFRSVSNDNSLYSLSFQFDLENDLDVPNHVVLLVNGRASAAMHASLNDANAKELHLVCSGINQQYVDDALSEFGAEIRTRTHPGYKIRTVWKPTRETFKTTDDVTLQLNVTNMGETPFTFMDGGQQRGSRNNQFGFTMFSQSGFGPAIPDTGDPVNFGGLAAYRTLKPGETFVTEVNLRDWFKFEKPDTYLVTGSFRMEFVDHQTQGWNPLWDDFATNRCFVTITGNDRN